MEGIGRLGGFIPPDVQVGQYGPYFPERDMHTSPYTESPSGSGVWVPDDRPYPPGSVRSGGWDAKAAASAVAADAALRKTCEALNRADRELAHNITEAHTADAQSKAQLQRITQEIRLGVAAVQPTLGTAAGREQLAEFLDRKASEAKGVVGNAQEMSVRLAANFEAVGHQFAAASDPWD